MNNEIQTIKTIKISSNLYQQMINAYNNQEYEIDYEPETKREKGGFYLTFYPANLNPINIKITKQ